MCMPPQASFHQIHVCLSKPAIRSSIYTQNFNKIKFCSFSLWMHPALEALFAHPFSRHCNLHQAFAFRDGLVPFATSEHGLQRARDWLLFACDQAGMKISTENIEVLCVSINSKTLCLQSARTRPYSSACAEVQGPVFTSDGKQKKYIHTSSSKCSSACSLSLCGNKTVQTSQSCHFVNPLFLWSAYMFMNLGCCLQKCYRMQTRQIWDFLRSSLRDTSRQSAQLWNS